MKEEKEMQFELSLNQKRFWLLNKENYGQLYTQISIKFLNSIKVDNLVAILNQIIGTHEALSSKWIKDENSIFPLQMPGFYKTPCIEILQMDDYENWISNQDTLSTTKDNNPIQFFIFTDAENTVTQFVYRVNSFWTDLFGGMKILDNINTILSGNEIINSDDESFIVHRNFAAWQNELLLEEENEGLDFWSDYSYDLTKQLIPFGNKSETNFKPKKLPLYEIKAGQFSNFLNDFHSEAINLELHFLAATRNWLAQYGESKMTLGYELFERIYEELNETVGLVSKSVPLLIDQNFELNNKASVEQLAERLENIKDWSDYYGAASFDANPDHLRYKVCFQFIDTRLALQDPSSSYQIDDIFNTQETFEIKLSVTLLNDKLKVDLYYNENNFDQNEIQVIQDQLMDVLRGTFNETYFPAKNSNIIPSILEELNSYDQGKIDLDHSVLDLIRKQVEQNPNSIAIQSQNDSITYQDLWDKSNALANVLIDKFGSIEGKPIAVLLNDALNYVPTVLAILKAGAFFVPLDQSNPAARINYVLSDCKCVALITESKFESIIDFEGKLLLFKEILAINAATNNPAVAAELAYTIYTSGSTGQPKGVLVGNKSLTNYVSWAAQYYLGQGGGNSALFTSFSFDLTLTSIFVPLASGKTVFAQNEDLSIDEKLINIFGNPKIDLIKLTPSHINLLSVLDLKVNRDMVFIVGGEALTKQQSENLFNLGENIKIYNEYGPTEATVGCIVKEISRSDQQILIGRAIANTKIKIVGQNGNATIGNIGEILIGGECLSVGYLNKPEETKQAFVLASENSKERYYKSGDLGRALPNGDLQYMGRVDNQIKIRGYRVELGEIEHQLMQHAAISDAALIYKENSFNESALNHGELVAFFVTDSVISTQELRDWLKNALPDYMIPHIFLPTDKIPLTENGKTDRKLMFDLALNLTSEVEYVAPTSEQEKVLVSVWSDVLKREKIGVKDSFYNLGGDSIKSIQVVARLKQKGYALKVENLLRTPVLEDLARIMRETTHTIDQSGVQGKVEFTPIQQWFFESEVIKKQHHFNQSVMLKSTERIDITVLEKCLIMLTQHHDALRMVIQQSDAEQVQLNNDVNAKSFTIDSHDLSESEDFVEQITEQCDTLQANISLNEGPLVKVAHFKLKEDDRLALIIHHLVVDGVSWRILLEDLSSLYTAFKADDKATLPLKTDSFQKWAQSLNDYAKSNRINAVRTYWEAACKRRMPSLPQDKYPDELLLPMDAAEAFSLNERSTELLQTRVHNVYKTEINDILLTCLGLAISEVLMVDRVVLKMEGHGREEIIEGIDISRTVGWFTSIYPFVLDVSDTSNPTDSLIGAKEALRKIPNKGIDYGILKYLTEEGLQSKLTPEIEFNYLGDFGSAVGNDETSIFDYASENSGTSVAKENGNDVVLDIVGMLVNGELSLAIRYSSLRYESDTIKKLAKAYEKNLEHLIDELGNSRESHLTPSDLSFKGLKWEELSEINAESNVEDIYELSPLQEGIYFLWLSENSSTLYLEQMSYRVKAKGLDIEQLRQTYDQLVERHSVLRTSFSNAYAQESLQIVRKSIPSNFTYEKTDSSVDAVSYLDEVKQKDKALGFDLNGPSQMRLHVVELSKGEYEFIWSFHHILMDGWCSGILMNDFNEILSAKIMGNMLNLGPVVPYSSYINWLRTLDTENSLVYWKNYLKDYLEIASVPFTLNTEVQAFEESRENLIIYGEVFNKIEALCNQIGITQNTFLQGIWGYLLSRYNNTNDVVFGAVVSGRPPELQGVEDIIGLFINTIPVRVKYKETDSPLDLLTTLQEESIQSTAHHNISLSEVQAQGELGMNMINHVMIFENYVVKDLESEGVLNSQGDEALNIQSTGIFEQINYDFSITVAPRDSELGISIVYNNNKYDQNSIKILKEHLFNLIESFVLNGDDALNTIDYITEQEKEQLLLNFNNNTVAYSSKTVIELFEDQVSKTPDAIAVEFSGETLTYQALNNKCNNLEVLLREKHNVSKTSNVGVMLDRSMESIIAMIGLMKTGACYVPIDPDYPTERITYIVEDAGLNVFISQSEILEKHGLTGIDLVNIKNMGLEGDAKNPEKANNLEDGAYVIYTSGSTGKPKGVVQTHKMLSNLIQWDINHSGVGTGLKLLQYASFSFDSSLHDIYFVLSSGGSAYVVQEASRMDYQVLKQEIVEKEIEVISMPFSALSAFSLEVNFNTIETHSIKHILSTAEQLYVSNSLKEFLTNNPTIDLHNNFGPSETHVITSHKMSAALQNIENRSPIGQPVANTNIYILDSNEKLAPQGVLGQMYVGGANLAKGYLNMEEATNEKFVASPFIKDERLYKTGDICRWLPDGNLEFLGRADDQVKIRGYRIELGEIEHSLTKNEEIESAVVLAVPNTNGENELVAYITAKQPQNVSDLRAYLKAILPNYMLPAYFVQLEEMPLTPNAKVDKEALPTPDGLGIASGVEYVTPRNKVEEKLVKIWEELLQRENIGINDDFFALGGHSLTAMKLLMEYNNVFNVKLSLKDIFIESQLYLHAELFDIQNWVIDEPEQITQENEDTETFKF
ncbi:MAG: amino acid adenylation domain-containing protein [Crocinitomix sp.]|jgi:amino acid adenylation domain-containing protein/non-ribosomal peptide synthase protein (TIGR01720 family)